VCEPEAFNFPDLPDEVIVAIDNFLEEFYTRFQNHYFAQMHRYYQDLREQTDELQQIAPPLSDPPF
jgi:hypothetical protein